VWHANFLFFVLPNETAHKEPPIRFFKKVLDLTGFSVTVTLFIGLL
jgi:hypothetical protein